MIWGIVVVAGIIAFFLFPAFRVIVVVIGGLLVIVIAVYLVNQHVQTQASKHRVSLKDLTFSDMRMGSNSFGYTLTGRVKNNSPYSVFEINAKVKALDCDEESHCVVVGEDDAYDIAPLVPPGQARDIDQSIYFGDAMHIRGQFRWNYAITEIRAR